MGGFLNFIVFQEYVYWHTTVTDRYTYIEFDCDEILYENPKFIHQE